MTYAPLVKYIVFKKVRELPARCEVEDFISCGLEALIASIDRYDPEKGATLEQFAWTRIHGAVLDELRRQDWAPRSLRRWERDIHRSREQFTSLHGRRPTREELADDAGRHGRGAAPPPGRHLGLRRHLAQHARDLRRRDRRSSGSTRSPTATRASTPSRPPPPRPARTSSAAPSRRSPSASARSPSCCTSRTSRCARSATSSGCPRAASARSTRSSSARSSSSSPTDALLLRRRLRRSRSSPRNSGRSAGQDDLRDRPPHAEVDPVTAGSAGAGAPGAFRARRTDGALRPRGRDPGESLRPRSWPRSTPPGSGRRELAAANRELHFRRDEATGRIIIEVRTLDGEVLRTIPPSRRARRHGTAAEL